MTLQVNKNRKQKRERDLKLHEEFVRARRLKARKFRDDLRNYPQTMELLMQIR